MHFGCPVSYKSRDVSRVLNPMLRCYRGSRMELCLTLSNAFARSSYGMALFLRLCLEAMTSSEIQSIISAWKEVVGNPALYLERSRAYSCGAGSVPHFPLTFQYRK